jgi:hypothetical protein
MKITHNDLKRAYKSHIQSRIPTSREACPSAESVFSVFDKTVSPEDKDRIIDHITGCCYCLQEFELFLDFYRQEEKAVGDFADHVQRQRTGSVAPSKRARIWGIFSGSRIKVHPMWRWTAASLVAFALIVLSTIGIRSFFKAPQGEERGRLPGQVRLIYPVHGEKIKMPLVFRWEGTARAEYFDLEIFDASLLPLWKSPPLEGLQYQLPPEAAYIIQKNEVCFWMITAWLIDGTKRESLLEEFTIKE